MFLTGRNNLHQLRHFQNRGARRTVAKRLEQETRRGFLQIFFKAERCELRDVTDGICRGLQ